MLNLEGIAPQPARTLDVGSDGVCLVLANPLPMAVWGLIVVGLLMLGSLPAFIGLAVAMPVLGHATWHLYRRVVG